MKVQDNTLVHPEDSSNISYWSKKWGISISQLNDAIINTGSLNPTKLREHIRKETHVAPFTGIIKFFRQGVGAVH